MHSQPKTTMSGELSGGLFFARTMASHGVAGDAPLLCMLSNISEVSEPMHIK